MALRAHLVTVMARTRNQQRDVERGREGSAEIAWLEGSAQPQHDEPPQIGVINRNDPSRAPADGEESHEQPQDFDDSANELWSLYEKEAKSHDESRIETLKDDMDGVLIYAGLFSAVLTAFVVPKIQDLKVNPANQSVYYQNQSVQMLSQISQQLVSVGSQISANSTPPPPYPTFRASASDRRVNIFWLISLVCSLSAALLATLVQQWVRAYMRIFQKSRDPLKTARIRLFLFENARRLPMVAEVVPGLIHVSLILFFWGLGDIILQIDTVVFVATVVPIAVCVCLYLYCVLAPILDPRSPYRTPFSVLIWRLYRTVHNRFRGKVVKPESVEVRQEQSAMKKTEGRRDRDVCAIQWLIDNINGSNETQTFILAIPGSFNQKWGRDVWKGVVRDDQSTSTVDFPTQFHPGIPSPREVTTVHNLCRYVRYLLKTYSSEGDFMDAKDRRRRMRLCVETVASLVCCTDVELGLFGEVGEVGEVLSDLGDKERTNDPLTTRSNPSFTVRWTCLSLVAIWNMLDSNEVQQLARFSLDGIARFQTGHGGPGATALTAAQEIDDDLERGWASVVQLRLAKPWGQNRTELEIREILNTHEEHILELENIAIKAVGVEDVDWRISLLQETMDGVTHKLTRCLPGVFFNEMKHAEPIMISKAFDFSPVEITPLPPQLIFPGQQIQRLCTFGRRLRDIIDGQNTEMHEETLKSLETLREIPVALRGVNSLMKRQLWRLQDLHDGGGLGFTIELFFLTLRQLSSPSELGDFYTGTFKVITSNWEKKNSTGTQRILLDLLCDLVIRSRGVFSNFPYPPYIVGMLLDLVGKMVEGHGDSQPHINEVIQELEDDNLWNRMDINLRDRALGVIYPSASS